MLATARPDIVSDHIDLLLKIGLGQLGKSDYVLAKYTCIALRRIGGSQKKVKGALTDHTVRLPMDNPVFERLRVAVESTTVDQEWSVAIAESHRGAIPFIDVRTCND